MSHRQKKEKVRESAGESEEKTGEKYDELRGVRRGETCATPDSLEFATLYVISITNPHRPPPKPMGVRGIPRVLVFSVCVCVCVCSVSLCFWLLFLLHRLATQRVIATFPLHSKKIRPSSVEIKNIIFVLLP